MMTALLIGNTDGETSVSIQWCAFSILFCSVKLARLSIVPRFLLDFLLHVAYEFMNAMRAAPHISRHVKSLLRYRFSPATCPITVQVQADGLCVISALLCVQCFPLCWHLSLERWNEQCCCSLAAALKTLSAMCDFCFLLWCCRCRDHGSPSARNDITLSHPPHAFGLAACFTRARGLEAASEIRQVGFSTDSVWMMSVMIRAPENSFAHTSAWCTRSSAASAPSTHGVFRVLCTLALLSLHFTESGFWKSPSGSFPLISK